MKNEYEMMDIHGMSYGDYTRQLTFALTFRRLSRWVKGMEGVMAGKSARTPYNQKSLAPGKAVGRV